MTLPLVFHEKCRSVPREDKDKLWLQEKHWSPDSRNEEEKRRERGKRGNTERGLDFCVRFGGKV